MTTELSGNYIRGFKYAPKTGNFYRSYKSEKGMGYPKVFTTTCKHGYLRVERKGKTYKIHRLIFEIMTGKKIPSDLMVDHINGVKNDNRWENLRLVSAQGNTQNRKRNREGKILGACKKPDGNFESYITFDNRIHYLGKFSTDKEAGEAYNKAYNEIKTNSFNPDKKVKPFGNRYSSSTLTPTDVVEIRKKAKPGIVRRRLAEEYNVTPTTISNLLNGKTWSHIE